LDSFSEAEIQALIAVLELMCEDKPVDSQTLCGITYFRKYREDWSDALADLVTRGLLMWQGASYALTERGTEVADRLREARPPIYYWYTEYYEATRTSAAYAQFCERVFGRNFAQHGFSDMAQLKAMLEALALGPGDRVLDLGCGNGAMAEYISDATGARVTGIDYIPEAICQAQERAEKKPDRLAFHVGDIGHLLDERSRLGFTPGTFDALISIDTLYFTDLRDTVRQMRDLLAPGGQMALFYGVDRYLGAPGETFDPATLAPERTPLGEALLANGLRFEARDFSEDNYRHAQLKKQVLEELQAVFEAEGNTFLFMNRYGEARGVIAEFEAGFSARYLYHVRDCRALSESATRERAADARVTDLFAQ
jgi:SAM-dependent methyltransferase